MKNSPPISATGTNIESANPGIMQYKIGMDSNLSLGLGILSTGNSIFGGEYTFELPATGNDGFIDTGFQFDFKNGAESNLLSKQGLSIKTFLIFGIVERLHRTM